MNIVKKFIPDISIFLCYIAFYYFTFKVLFPIQSKFFGSDSMLAGALIFLPHGVRVISTIVYGLRSLIPLLCAHFVTILEHLDILGYNWVIILTFISSFCVWISILILFRKKNGLDLTQITFKNIILITIFSSFLNSFGNDFTRHFFVHLDYSHLFHKEFFFYMIGDFFGTILLFFLYIKVFKKFLIKTNSTQ